jgi:hypothetical protein
MILIPFKPLPIRAYRALLDQEAPDIMQSVLEPFQIT